MQGWGLRVARNGRGAAANCLRPYLAPWPNCLASRNRVGVTRLPCVLPGSYVSLRFIPFKETWGTCGGCGCSRRPSSAPSKDVPALCLASYCGSLVKCLLPQSKRTCEPFGASREGRSSLGLRRKECSSSPFPTCHLDRSRSPRVGRGRGAVEDQPRPGTAARGCGRAPLRYGGIAFVRQTPKKSLSVFLIEQIVTAGVSQLGGVRGVGCGGHL